MSNRIIKEKGISPIDGDDWNFIFFALMLMLTYNTLPI